LAEIYQVGTKNLNLSIKRNLQRFPSDFMFQLNDDEWNNLRLHFETSKRGGRRYLPYAFTEQGIAQLSSVLNSPFAIEMNIGIIRAFVALRQYVVGYTELNRRLEDFMLTTDIQFGEIYQALTTLAEQKKLYDNRKPIGFLANREEKQTN